MVSIRARLERLVADGLADEGWSLTLSNDPSYWCPARKVNPIHAAFRLHEGRQLSGTLGWAANAGTPCACRPASALPQTQRS